MQQDGRAVVRQRSAVDNHPVVAPEELDAAHGQGGPGFDDGARAARGAQMEGSRELGPGAGREDDGVGGGGDVVVGSDEEVLSRQDGAVADDERRLARIRPADAVRREGIVAHAEGQARAGRGSAHEEVAARNRVFSEVERRPFVRRVHGNRCGDGVRFGRDVAADGGEPGVQERAGNDRRIPVSGRVPVGRPGTGGPGDVARHDEAVRRRPCLQRSAVVGDRCAEGIVVGGSPDEVGDGFGEVGRGRHGWEGLLQRHRFPRRREPQFDGRGRRAGEAGSGQRDGERRGVCDGRRGGGAEHRRAGERDRLHDGGRGKRRAFRSEAPEIGRAGEEPRRDAGDVPGRRVGPHRIGRPCRALIVAQVEEEVGIRGAEVQQGSVRREAGLADGRGVGRLDDRRARDREAPNVVKHRADGKFVERRVFAVGVSGHVDAGEAEMAQGGRRTEIAARRRRERSRAQRGVVRCARQGGDCGRGGPVELDLRNDEISRAAHDVLDEREPLRTAGPEDEIGSGAVLRPGLEESEVDADIGRDAGTFRVDKWRGDKT